MTEAICRIVFSLGIRLPPSEVTLNEPIFNFGGLDGFSTRTRRGIFNEAAISREELIYLVL